MSPAYNSFVIDIFPWHISNLKTDFIKSSLESGFSPDSYLDDKISTALHLAAAHEEETDAITVAEILLKYGANPNIQRGKDGRTSLHIAASMGHMRLLDLLMCNGGDPLMGDIQGLSVVDLASSNNQPEMVSHINQLLNTENFVSVDEEKFTLLFKSKEIVDVLLDPQMSMSDDSFHTATETGDNGMDRNTLDGLISSTDQQVAAWCTNMRNNFQDPIRKSNEYTDITAESLSSSPDLLNSIKKSVLRNKFRDYKSTSSTDSVTGDVGPLRQCLLKALMRKDSKASQGSCYMVEELFSPDQQDIDLTMFEETEDVFHSRTLVEDSCNLTEDSSCVHVDQSDSPLDMAHLSNTFQDTYFELTDISNTAVLGADNIDGEYNDTGNIYHRSTINVNEDKRHCIRNKREEKENIFRKNDFRLPNTIPTFNLKSTIASTITVNSSGPPSIITVSSTRSIASTVEEYIYKDVEAGVTLIERRCPSMARISSFNGTGTLKSTTSVKHLDTRESQFLQTQDLSAESITKFTPKPSLLGRERWGSNGTPLSILDLPYIPSMSFPDIDRHGPMGTPLSILDVANPWHIPKSPTPQWKDAPISQLQFKQSNKKNLPVHLLTPAASVKISIIPPTPAAKEREIKEITTKGDIVLENNNETDCSNSTIGTVTESIAQMSVNELKNQLKVCGMDNIGPIMPCTQRTYQRHLLRLRKYPDMAYASNNGKEVQYPREITSAIEERGNVDWSSWTELEQIMCAPFKTIDPSRHWRDGNGKTCFNYLLLDPRITLELPIRGVAMSEAEKMKYFISSIFYIGKGSRGRPYHHLYQAIKDNEEKKNPIKEIDLKKKKARNKKYDSGAKVQRIQEIWKEGLGVVSLHIFQNTIPVEAWAREAAMINAVGLDNLTNSCQGTFYGPASTWRGSRRRQLGAYLLHLALNILMYEGERQLRPNDVPLPTWMK